MRCSVVVVVHQNYKPLLETALNSISISRDDEIVVVANGCHITPTEGYKVVHCEGTLAHACNEGIKVAEGRYILRVDSDDWVEPELITSLAAELEHTGYDAIWCDYMRAEQVGDGKGWQSYVIEPFPQDGLEHACGVMFKRGIWENLGGYDDNLEFQESFDFWKRFKKAGYKSGRLSVPLYYYRKHPGSMSTSPARECARAMIEAKYS